MSGRWDEVSRLFEEALQLAPDARDRYLEKACAGDAALEAEVRSLLAHHAQATGFLEPGTAGLSTSPPAFALPVGHSIGAWRVVRVLGEGGMGVVLLVERAEGGFQQQGALKLIRTGFATDELVRRFVRERQILAALQHPNIARLLDGGTTPEGLPYLVMEYIEGKSLYEYCSERGLSVEQRLELFLSVCSAVEYAHQKLVLHRDIKPGNLIVGADGAPKLLDFGISKMFDAEPDAGGDLRTLQLPMTPEYASPEQLRGEEMSAASDVYSLGVLLYELLTGARPFPATAVAHEFVRQVLERDPERPSTAVRMSTRLGGAEPTTGGRRRLPDPPRGTAQTLRRRLTGDLDNIVLKAMQRDPARRYASVEQLAADLGRYRRRMPVLARPDRWSYRAGKFVRRNALALAAGVALVAGLGVSVWQGSVARRQGQIAEHRYQIVRGLTNTLVFDVHDAVSNLPGGAPVREMVLLKAVTYLDSLAKEAGRDTTLRLDLADAYERIGVVQGEALQPNLGKPTEAAVNFEKALRLREGLLREMPGSARLLLGLANIYNKMAGLHRPPGHEDETFAWRRKSLDASQKVSDAFPANRSYLANLHVRRYNLGQLYYSRDPKGEGLSLMEAGRSGLAQMVRPDTSDHDYQRMLGAVDANYAQALITGSGRTDSIMTALARSERMFIGLEHCAPQNRGYKLQRAINLGMLAMVAWYRERDAERALGYATGSSAYVDTLAMGDVGNRDMELNRAIARFLMGYFRAVAGHVDDALPVLQESRVRWTALYRDTTYRSTAAAELESSDEADSWVHEHRAREAERRGAPSLGEWRAARFSLTKTVATFDSLNSSGETGSLIREQGAIMHERLAVMDSVLGAHAH